MGALSENPDHKPKTASANLRFGAGNWGLAGLKKLDLEKSVDLVLHQPFKVKADRLQDLDAFKLHDTGPGAESAHNKEIDLSSPL